MGSMKTPEEILSIRATRRQVLLLGLATIGAIITDACVPQSPIPATPDRRNPIPTTTSQPAVETAQALDKGKQRLNEELDQLPNSPIKSLLISRVKPLFGLNPPASINYDGLDIKLFTSAVVLKTVNINSVSSLYTPRDSSFVSEPLYPTQTTTLRIPYQYLLLDSERSTIPAGNFATDGTPVVDIQFPTDKALYEGLKPVITITTPALSAVKPKDIQLFRNFERFVYIKEACSLLLLDIFIEETVKKMHSLGLNTTLEARTSNGTIKQAEALIQSLSLVNNSQGRFNAVIDIAGYLLAFRATEETDINDPNNMDPGFAKVRPSMQAVNLGTSPQDILSRSLLWSFTTPDADKQLVHVGNVNKIP